MFDRSIVVHEERSNVLFISQSVVIRCEGDNSIEQSGVWIVECDFEVGRLQKVAPVVFEGVMVMRQRLSVVRQVELDVNREACPTTAAR